MFTLKQNGKIAALAACCMISLAAPVQAQGPSRIVVGASQYQSQFGAPVDGARYDREIVVGADTRWVNVVSGQVVHFVVADAAGANASFTWNFDTWGDKVADLSRLAPNGMVQRPIKVYIARDLRYSGA
jgi:hypothetical protein